jgi:hypothetical protein
VTAGGQSVGNIARWEGTAWQADGVGAGLSDAVTCLAVYEYALYAGGSFTAAGGVPAARIARWDGTAWTPLGSGLSACRMR